MTQPGQWNTAQYNKFREQRMQPFFDLVTLIRPRDGMRIIDLGCGTGELTALLAERFDATVEGIDTSEAMLADAAPRGTARVSFRRQDLTTVADFGAFDLVFSNAVLQWVPDNEALLSRLLTQLRCGAQIAIQVPKNEHHPSHRIAWELAQEPPFRDLLHGYVRESEALSLERYSGLLYQHGFREQVCIEKIYGHVLDRSSDVVEWVKGSCLGAYLSRLDDNARDALLAAYGARLLAEVGEQAPYFYPFRRALFWGQKQA